MPNVGPVEFFMLVLIFGIPIGIGYWCMRVFRRKLRSSGSGFALGFFLTLFLSLIGAAIAVATSYAQPSRTLIATFGQTGKGWPGRKITYDNQASCWNRSAESALRTCSRTTSRGPSTGQ